MVSIYIRRINNGLMTIEEVPIKWRSEVEKELGI
ncbi:CD1375 family protein [Clostridium sp. C2-6-12]|nr:CD1375 family protein [Clostridium sp. C2-6-12]